MVLASLNSFLPDSFETVFHGMPVVHQWVSNLKTTGVASLIQKIFAEMEVVHILGLFMLSACIILTSLRLIGVGLTGQSPSVIVKNTRMFLNIGIVLAIVSGILIGISNAEKLYNSAAFLLKMIALAAGIIFAYFVMIPVAQRDGQATSNARIAAVVAMAIWVISLVFFSVKTGANPGMFHVLSAGALIAFVAIQGKLRWVFTAGVVGIFVVWNVVTHIYILEATGDRYMQANHTFMLITGAWVLGMSLLNIFGKGAVAGSNNFARMVGYSTILVWVTVGAAGRWIGLS